MNPRPAVVPAEKAARILDSAIRKAAIAEGREKNVLERGRSVAGLQRTRLAPVDHRAAVQYHHLVTGRAGEVQVLRREQDAAADVHQRIAPGADLRRPGRVVERGTHGQLLALGAAVNARSTDGNTPLIAAAANGDSAVGGDTSDSTA